jgi:hypothetical protein
MSQVAAWAAMGKAMTARSSKARWIQDLGMDDLLSYG